MIVIGNTLEVKKPRYLKQPAKILIGKKINHPVKI